VGEAADGVFENRVEPVHGKREVARSFYPI
jgi:hypothetical protein